MFWKLRSTAFAIALTLVTGTAAEALPLSGPSLPSLQGEESLLRSTWEWVSSLLTKAGGMMDPDGTSLQNAGMMDPAGRDAGGMMDPDGLR